MDVTTFLINNLGSVSLSILANLLTDIVKLLGEPKSGETLTEEQWKQIREASGRRQLEAIIKEIEPDVPEPLRAFCRSYIRSTGLPEIDDDFEDALFELCQGLRKWSLQQTGDLSALVDGFEHSLLLSNQKRILSLLESGLQGVGRLYGLPEKIEPFVGHIDEIKIATEHLLAQRSSCFYGMGGIGKSALAIEIAYKIIDNNLFDHILWCPIEERNIGVVCDTIGDALGIKGFASLSIEQKKSRLRSVLMDKKALLILDDVPDRKYFKELMDAVGTATVLTTARSMMTSNSLPSSRCILISGLEPQYAQSLFVQRSGIENPDMSVVAEICERLGYHPLAIRIAADSPTVKNVSAAKFLSKLQERGIEVVSDADEKDKNYNVMRSFDISYEGLNESDQAVFSHLGVFNGSFDENAVSAVSQCDDVEVALERLVKYSLVTQLKTGRYKLHELMKDYANRKLASVELTEAQKRHSRYYAKAAERLGELPIERWKEYDADWENIRAGANFAAEQMKNVQGRSLEELARECVKVNMDKDALTLVCNYALALYDYTYSRRIPEGLSWLYAGAVAFDTLGDSERLSLMYNRIGMEYSLENYKEALRWYLKALNIIEELGIPKALAILYNNIASAYQNQGNYEEALKWYRKSMEIDEKRNNKSGLSITYNNIGTIYKFRGYYDEALMWYEKSMEITNAKGSQARLAATYNNIGEIHRICGDFDKALMWCKKGLRITEEIGDKAHLPTAYNNIGKIYLSQDNYDEVLIWFEKGLEIAEATHNPKGLALTYNNIGSAYDSCGDYEEALKWYDKSVEISKKIGDHAELANTYNNIGEVHRALGNYEKALIYHEKSMKIEKKIGNLAGLATTYNNIACVHYARLEYEEASKWYKKSIELKREIGDRTGLALTLHNMGWAAMCQKDFSKALEYFTQSRDIYIEIKLPKNVAKEEDMIAQVKLQMSK